MTTSEAVTPWKSPETIAAEQKLAEADALHRRAKEAETACERLLGLVRAELADRARDAADAGERLVACARADNAVLRRRLVAARVALGRPGGEA
jgi:hypothetical protein